MIHAAPQTGISIHAGTFEARSVYFLSIYLFSASKVKKILATTEEDIEEDRRRQKKPKTLRNLMHERRVYWQLKLAWHMHALSSLQHSNCILSEEMFFK